MENIDKTIFPTFEEALGVFRLSSLKNESFKDFTILILRAIVVELIF
jgi:hypothetical protein